MFTFIRNDNTFFGDSHMIIWQKNILSVDHPHWNTIKNYFKCSIEIRIKPETLTNRKIKIGTPITFEYQKEKFVRGRVQDIYQNFFLIGIFTTDSFGDKFLKENHIEYDPMEWLIPRPIAQDDEFDNDLDEIISMQSKINLT